MWATGGPPLGPDHWPPIVARRRELLARLDEWTPPPALGSDARGGHRPDGGHAVGRDAERLQEWAASTEGAPRGSRARPRRPGRSRGAHACSTIASELGRCQDGEILVCSDHVARLGADLPEDQGHRHRHRRRDVARRDRLARIRQAGGRRHGPRDVADQDGSAAAGRRCERGGRDPRRRRLSARGDRAARRARLRDEESCSAARAPRSASCSPAGSRSRWVRALGRRLQAFRRNGLLSVPRRSPGSTSTTSPRRGRARLTAAAIDGPPGMPDAVRERYAERSQRDGGERRPSRCVRARVGEDSAEATFAGQQETYLWVRGPDAGLRRRTRLLGEPAQPTGDQPIARGSATHAAADDGRRRAAHGRRRGRRRPLHLQPASAATRASSRSTRAGGSALAVVGGEVTPDEYLVSKVTGEVVRGVGEREARRVPRRPAAAPGPCDSRCLRSGRARRASTMLDARGAGAHRAQPSSATSAPIRTSSGRSTGPRADLRPAGAAGDGRCPTHRPAAEPASRRSRS